MHYVICVWLVGYIFQVEVAKNAFHQADTVEGSEENSPKEVGHNIYILAHQLAQHNLELAELLKQNTDEAMMYYAKHTAQIEVCQKTWATKTSLEKIT